MSNLTNDTAVLADVNWIKLCVVDVTTSRQRATRSIDDRCTGDEKEYTGGKRETSVNVNLNELRLTQDMVRDWQTISDSLDVIAIMVLNSERTDADTYGFGGNFIVEQDDDAQPAEGLNTNTITFRPAYKSAFSPKVRRIYGANGWPTPA